MVLDDPMLDQTHDEFLKLLYKLKNTSFEVILPVLDELIIAFFFRRVLGGEDEFPSGRLSY